MASLSSCSAPVTEPRRGRDAKRLLRLDGREIENDNAETTRLEDLVRGAESAVQPIHGFCSRTFAVTVGEVEAARSRAASAACLSIWRNGSVSSTLRKFQRSHSTWSCEAVCKPSG